MKFKPAFQKRYSTLTDFEAYQESVKQFARKSIRVNTLHYSIRAVKKSLLRDGWRLEQIPWCKEGFYATHKTGRRDIGNTEQHKQGMLFSQASPSMIPAQLMNIKKHQHVLDLCAAPGGKTHHLACLMKNTGTIIANDYNGHRRTILKKNMERCGVRNVTVTGQRAEQFTSETLFDAILVDAPCTGSGLIKGKIARTKKLLKEWNPHITAKYARMQHKIITHAWQFLKPQGRLVYATCSLEPEEDELIVEKFLGEHEDCTLVLPEIKENHPKSSLKKYIKIWPQYYDTHGFFISVLEKT